MEGNPLRIIGRIIQQQGWSQEQERCDGMCVENGSSATWTNFGGEDGRWYKFRPIFGGVHKTSRFRFQGGQKFGWRRKDFLWFIFKFILFVSGWFSRGCWWSPSSMRFRDVEVCWYQMLHYYRIFAPILCWCWKWHRPQIAFTKICVCFQRNSSIATGMLQNKTNVGWFKSG